MVRGLTEVFRISKQVLRYVAECLPQRFWWACKLVGQKIGGSKSEDRCTACDPPGVTPKAVVVEEFKEPREQFPLNAPYGK